MQEADYYAISCSLFIRIVIIATISAIFNILLHFLDIMTNRVYRCSRNEIHPLPLCCAACTAQQGKALGHIGQLRHPAQPHWPAAQQGRCQQRQHTVLGRRDLYRSIQRPPARDDVIPCHAKTPVLPKIPHGMQNEGRRFPVLYPDTAKRICPVVCLFFASFAGQTDPRLWLRKHRYKRHRSGEEVR